MFRKKSRSAICFALWVILFAFTVGCSGGNSPINPDTQGDPNHPQEPVKSPREVLSAFADACIAQDIDAACAQLNNPRQWRSTLEFVKDMLPIAGKAIHEAEEIESGEDCVRYLIRLSHPDDPQHRVMEIEVYVIRSPGRDGSADSWGVEFVYSNSSLERNAQWGAKKTHSNYITPYIIDYYCAMYPEDIELTHELGFFSNPNYNFKVQALHPGDIQFNQDIYNFMPPEIDLDENFARALVQAGSVDEDVFVGELNEDGTINYERNILLLYNGEWRFETSVDFGPDDDSIFKGLAHFFTPENQEIGTEFVAFDDLPDWIDIHSVGALDWAFGEGTAGPITVPGGEILRPSRNRKTFQRSVGLYKEAQTTAHPVISAELFGSSFYTLGFTLHLLEDIGCPAHVRNDMHGVPYSDYLPGFDFLKPDPMEFWVENADAGLSVVLDAMYDDLVAQNDPIVRDETGFPDNDLLQSFYGSGDYPMEYAGVEALFKYTAFVTNRMCLSEDTIYRSTKEEIANTKMYPELTTLVLDEVAWKASVYGNPGDEIPHSDYLVARDNGLPFILWVWNYRLNHLGNDPDIDDLKAELEDDPLDTNLRLLTVVDVDDDDYFGSDILGVREQQWQLLFPLIVRTGAAYLHEFYLATKSLIFTNVDTPGYAYDVAASDGYAYVADDEEGLQIIDIDPLISASLVNSVDIPGACGVAVSGDYAYVTDGSGLTIIDIDPPESAYIVNTVDTPGHAWGVAVSGDYAYVTDWLSGLHIIDINPPQSAYLVNTVDTPDYAYGVAVADGYAYVANDSGLTIIDIDPPASADIVKTVNISWGAENVAVSDGYAYVVGVDNGLTIIDIDTPESAYIFTSIGIWYASGVTVAGEYAYVTDWLTGLRIIDIDPPDLAHTIITAGTPGCAWDVAVSDGYASVADGDAGLQIVGIPEYS